MLLHKIWLQNKEKATYQLFYCTYDLVSLCFAVWYNTRKTFKRCVFKLASLLFKFRRGTVWWIETSILKCALNKFLFMHHPCLLLKQELATWSLKKNLFWSPVFLYLIQTGVLVSRLSSFVSRHATYYRALSQTSRLYHLTSTLLLLQQLDTKI